ncbi:hypothetical protein D3C78_478110 [compost metagenome]
MIATSMTSGILRFEIGEIGQPMIEQAAHAIPRKCGMLRPDLRAPVRPSVAKPTRWRYLSPVAVNPAAGFGDPINSRRNSATKTFAGAFFVPAMSCHGGCAWETERSAGFLESRFANLRTVASNDRLATVGGGSSTLGAPPMKHDPARNPSALREPAAAHRAMAIAALHADSSLSVRLKRYNRHMAICRELEATAAEQQTTSTRDPHTALAWLKAGKSIRIDSLNLRDHLRHVRALATLEGQGGAK